MAKSFGRTTGSPEIPNTSPPAEKKQPAVERGLGGYLIPPQFAQALLTASDLRANKKLRRM